MADQQDSLTPDQKLRDTLRRLVDACNFRDAVVASHHTDKLDYAVENYALAMRKAQDVLTEWRSIFDKGAILP